MLLRVLIGLCDQEQHPLAVSPIFHKGPKRDGMGGGAAPAIKAGKHRNARRGMAQICLGVKGREFKSRQPDYVNDLSRGTIPLANFDLGFMISFVF